MKKLLFFTCAALAIVLPFSCASVELKEDDLEQALNSSDGQGISSSSSALPDGMVLCVYSDICSPVDVDVCDLVGGTYVQSCPEVAVDLSKIELAVIFRDFPADQDGFEEFDVDKSTRKCAGTDGNNNTHSTSYDQICVKGNVYVYCNEGGEPLYYGKVNTGNAYEIRGYWNGPDAHPNRSCTDPSRDYCWKNPVYVTRDMVKTRLDYSQCEESVRLISNPVAQAIEGLHCARPAPENNSRCDGDKVSSWFTDGGAAKRIEGEIILDRVGNTSLYRIEHDYNKKVNWNGFGDDNGYFPLDRYDGGSYGKQSMNIWCWKKSSETYSLPTECNSFLGGQSAKARAKDPYHAEWFVNNERTDLKARWHNYNFTMAGFGKFKYQQGAGDRFEFIGDDDMWIFIDGELAADLGGTHLAAPAKIFIDEYAASKGWENESYHAINFFYTERQTDGSNIMLQVALTDLQPSRFGH